MTDRPSSWLGPLAHGVVVVAVAAVLSLPCLLVGIPAGYDSEYHVAYQYHFNAEFWNGDLYPRWLPGANKGYGSPIFLLQYPLPYFVTALIRPIGAFPVDAPREARELGVFFFLALSAAGLAGRAWFRNHCTPSGATLAALVYMALPYVLGQAVYMRAALGELCAFVWMPLALAACDRLRPRLASISVLALVLGLFLLSHVVSTLLFVPLLVGYAIVTGRATHASLAGCVGSVSLALVMAMGIAAVYVFPLVAYQSFFDMGAMQLAMPSFELGRWFSFVTSSGATRRFVIPATLTAIGLALVCVIGMRRAPGNIVGRGAMAATLGLGLVMLIPDLGPALVRLSGFSVSSFETAGDFSARMLFTGVFTVALGCLAYIQLGHLATRREHLLLGVLCAAFLLSLPWSAPLWKANEQMAGIHFPFRLAGVVTVAAVGLFAVAADRALHQRDQSGGRAPLVLLAAVALAVVSMGSLTWRVPERFLNPQTAHHALAHNVDNMFRSYVPLEQVDTVAMHLRTAADSFRVVQTPLDDDVKAECTGGAGTASVTRVRPRVLFVDADCPEGEGVRVRQLYWPLWKVIPTTTPRDAAALTRSEEGFIEVSLPSGREDFELVFDMGWPKRAGMVVTLVSVSVVLIGFATCVLGGGSRWRGGQPRRGTDRSGPGPLAWPDRTRSGRAFLTG